MSQIHVLGGDESGNTFFVVLHFPVADTVNYVDYSYRQAIVEWLGGTSEIKSQCPFIDSGELAQMVAGEIFEVVLPFYSNPSMGLTAKRDALVALWTSEQAATQIKIQNKLGYWGYSYDIP